MRTYYYFNQHFPIKVTDDTVKLTPYTFQPNNNIWEVESIFQFFSHINPHRECNIADVGAQSGSYSLFAKYLPNAHFFSFEPFEQSYNLLNENLKLNDIHNVNTHNIALSDVCGTSTLNTSISHNGFHTLGENPLRFTDIKPVQIQTDTLDSYFYDVDKKLHFLKIDTEGWEYNILKGGRKTIEEYKPIIQLEWVKENMKQCSIDERDLMDILNSWGYKEHTFWSRFNAGNEEKLFVPGV